MELPPGFRFHPTDEELITHYLCKKVHDSNFRAIAVGEADLNKSEPWDLPKNAKMGENEWYVFCLRDKKYPTGLRTNRATRSGYWKATGKDKEIRRGKFLVGMKKTLVFYRGRAPKGMKSNWVMHEFRLEGNLSLQNLPQSAKTVWVISRVFEKCYGVKKPLLSDSDRFGQGHVPCFSNQDALVNSFNTTSLASLMNQNYQNSNGVQGQHDIDHARLLSHLLRKTQQFKTDVVAPPNPDPDPGRSVATGPVDLQCLWNY